MSQPYWAEKKKKNGASVRFELSVSYWTAWTGAIRKQAPKRSVLQTPPGPFIAWRKVKRFRRFRAFCISTVFKDSPDSWFRDSRLSAEPMWWKSGAASAAAETKLVRKDFWESLKAAGLDRDVSGCGLTQERGVGASQQGISPLTLTGDITGRSGRNA